MLRCGLVSFFLFVLCFQGSQVTAQVSKGDIKIVPVDSGWANNSVNTVIFRKNSLVTWKDTQFIAFYDRNKHVVLGKRKLGSKAWVIRPTPYTGNASDAHNAISIMVDGDGYLHLSWDHHNNALRYCKGIAPGSLELTDKLEMTGFHEQHVSYPEFFRLNNGNLLFLYRDGESGRGNLVINQYDLKSRQWSLLHNNLIDGEGARNAYWQACTDPQGIIHISWVWRESPDVASNHDLCYARSADGGKTWETTAAKRYDLPITAAKAEYIVKIPQHSELINQTSMATDAKGNPFIATYWREANSQIPQYHVLYKNAEGWQSLSLNFRTMPFSLSGGGTKRIPISRPQIVVKGAGRKASVLLIFRDTERGDRISVVSIKAIGKKTWKLLDLSPGSVGSWEPTYDTELWKESGILNLFVQKVEQVDGEGQANVPPRIVEVMEWRPGF